MGLDEARPLTTGIPEQRGSAPRPHRRRLQCAGYWGINEALAILLHARRDSTSSRFRRYLFRPHPWQANKKGWGQRPRGSRGSDASGNAERTIDVATVDPCATGLIGDTFDRRHR